MGLASVDLCRLCGSATTQDFLHRSQVPVHQNLLAVTEREAIGVPRGDLRMMVCENCGFVFNAAFDSSRLSYGEHYENTQSYSPMFARHMEDLANHLLDERGVRGKTIVEVGCGKGDFLRLLVSGDARNTGVGYDPSYLGESEQHGGRLRFKRRMFGPDCPDVKPDIVVCRHVIEHVLQPLELLKQVKEAVSSSRSPRLFFETPCVGWILQNFVIWDFFYEHCSLFTAASLAGAFRAAGFRVAGVHRVFGEQYLWIEASVEGDDGFRAPDATNVPVMARTFAEQSDAAVAQWVETVASLRVQGRVAIWGAGAKGATFVDLVDRPRSMIDCVVDINPNKQGHFIPGTGHPIVSPRELVERKIAAAILMNPNYLVENQDLLRRERIQTRLLV